MAAPRARRFSTCRKLPRILFTFYAITVYFFPALVIANYDFYSFAVDDAKGREIPLAVFRGKPALIVNVASKCGYTRRHYEDLVWANQQPELEDKLHILAFPCNQFGQQEPGSIEEIIAFTRSYGVTFPVFSKIDVVGKYAHPAYIYLTNASGQRPAWNFWKYLIDRQGRVIDAWGPTTSVREIFDFLVAATKTKSGREDL